MDALTDRMKIGLIGLGPYAGTGFMSSSLARALAERGGYHPAVLELGKGGLFDGLGMDRHFADRQFFYYHQAVLQDKSIRGRCNDWNGVNWVLLPEGENGSRLDLFRKLRLINNAAGDIIICRLSGVEGEDLWRLLCEMDRILMLIDPLPSKMLPEYEFLCALRVSELPVIYVINKYNGGIYRRELLDYLKLKKLLFIPSVNQESIYGAEYTCRVVYDMPNARKQLEKPFEALIKEIFAL